MKEDFPIFLWKYQVFLKSDLSTTSYETIQIINQGVINFNAGPDFNQAKVVIDGMLWVGDVEIHVNSSDWKTHKHQLDPAYNKVILHVVWEHDITVKRKDGSSIPTLELKHRVRYTMLSKYNFLKENLQKIPCYPDIMKAEKVLVTNMIEKAVIQRLERKAAYVFALLGENISWEEIAYRVVAKNFGFKVNAEAFLRLSEVLPWKLLRRHGDNLFQLEALMLGMAGLLSFSVGEDEYSIKLKSEFAFLCHKYGLNDKVMPSTYWKFFRTRPVNFPTIRIAQFAQLCFRHYSMFSIFKELNDLEDYLSVLAIDQSSYWRNHYYFGKVGKREIPGLGMASINNLIINAIVTLKIAYGRQKDDEKQIESAIKLLEQLPAENNKITRMWKENGITATNAFQTQGLIELFQHFCVGKKCLNCNIGISILSTV